MSVVKKLKEGGITPTTYEEHIAKRLAEANFTKEGEKLARQSAKNWRDLYGTDGFSDAYSYDQITQNYSVDVNKINDDRLKGLEWGGSRDKINKNVVGQYSGQPDKSNKNDPNAEQRKYNSLISSWTNEFLKNNPKAANPQKRAGFTKSIPVLSNFIKDEIYGGQGDVFEREWNGIESEEDKRKKLLEYSKSNVNQYLEDYNKNSEIDTFENHDKVLALNNAIDSGDWEGFKQNAFALGWDPENYLMSDEEKQSRIDLQKQKDRQELEKTQVDETLNGLIENGLIEEDARALMDLGYTNLDNEWSPENSPWFRDFLNSQNAKVMSNADGKRAIIKDGSFFNHKMSPFSKGYGSYWNHDPETNELKFTNPESDDWDQSSYVDPYVNQVGGRKIKGKVEGNPMATIYGYGDQNSYDPLGNKDYSKHLVISNPDQTMFDVFKNDEGNYVDSEGKVIDLKLEDFGKDFTEFNPIKTIENDEFSKIKPKRNFTDVSDIKESLELIESNKGRSGKVKLGDAEYLKLKNIFEDLKYRMSKSKNISDRNEAFKLYTELKNNYKGKVEAISNITAGTKPRTIYRAGMDHSMNFMKKGGRVVKAQAGLKLSVSNYNNIANTKPTKEVKDVRGSLRDASFWDIASTAGTVASFIPGVGGIGGAVTTIADIVNDVKNNDGKTEWGTHLTNIGFTALSTIGLGGLRGIKIAAKLAKAGKIGKSAKKVALAVDELDDVGRIVNKLKGVSTKALPKGQKAVKLLTKSEQSLMKKATGFHFDEYGHTVRRMINPNKVGSFMKKEDALVDITKTLQSKSGNLATELAQKVATKFKLPKVDGITKIAKIGVAGAVGVQALPAVGNIVSNVKEEGLGQGLLDTQLSDFKKVGMAASLGSNFVRGKVRSAAVKNQSKPIVKGKDSYTIKTKNDEYSLKESVKVPNKSRSVKSPLKKNYKESELKSFEKDLKNAGLNTEQSEKVIKELKEGNVDYKEIKSELTGYKVNKIADYTKGVGKGNRELKLAKKAEKGPQDLLMKAINKILKKEKGGVLKFSGGNKFNLYDDRFMKLLEPLPKTTAGKNNILPGVTVVGNKKVLSPRFSSFSSTQFSKSDPTHLRIPDSEKLDPMNKLSMVNSDIFASLDKPGDAFSKLIGQRPENTSLKYSVASGFGGETKKNVNLKGIMSNFDQTDLANLGMFMNTIRGNRKASQAQKRAAMDSAYQIPLMSKRFIRESAPDLSMYDNNANKITNVGKRISNSVSDIDKGIATRLESEAKAVDVRNQGSASMQERLDRIRQYRDQVNAQVDQQNNQIVGNNRAISAGVRQKVHLIDSNLHNAKTTALNNLITASDQNIKVKKAQNKNQQLYDAYVNPELQSSQKQFNTLLGQESGIKERWQNYLNSDEGKNITDKDIGNFQEYIDWKNNVSTLKESIQGKMNKIQELQMAMKFGAKAKYKSGGSISDKLTLENAKDRNKKASQNTKNTYLSIFHNNRMMLDSLIKVFK